MVRARVDLEVLDEVSRWRTDDQWFWALQALVVSYARVPAEHGGETVPAICRRVASRHGVQLAAAT
jgi:hypothetical protein